MADRILFYTAARSASMFIYDLASELSEMKGIQFTSLNGENAVTFDYLITPDNWNHITGCVAPMRSMIDVPGIEHDSVILHLRDPRDLLTSWYYAIAYSHQFEDNLTPEMRERYLKLGIDEAMFESEYLGKVLFDAILNMYRRYHRSLIGKPNVTFVTYEELVSDYLGWLRKVIPVFKFENEEEVLQLMLDKHKDSFKVESEDLYSHKRQIIPGDHRRKLKPETVDFLNEQFREVLELFGFPVSETVGVA